MATLTKISPSRMGPPRFGTKPYVFDNSVKTYQLTPEQLERYRNGEKLEDILKEEEMMGKPKVISFNKYLEVLAERDELQKQLEELKANATQDKDDVQIEWLKHEADQAHKLLTEKEKEVEQLRELFETAMADKERLHKENLILENEVQRLKEANDELTAKNERYFADLMRLEQEVKGLRLYALQKLHIDVYGV